MWLPARELPSILPERPPRHGTDADQRDTIAGDSVRHRVASAGAKCDSGDRLDLPHRLPNVYNRRWRRWQVDNTEERKGAFKMSSIHEISEQKIAERAYKIWQDRGCPAGDGADNWEAAKSALRCEAQQPKRRQPLRQLLARLRNRAAV